MDEKLAFPAGQALHVEAPLLTTPVPTPISVTEPAAHVAHATIGAAEYVPAQHVVHVVALLFTARVVRAVVLS
eukprot:COSAG01_NODE_64656_length_275_cov_15.068182_1_plen_72_part_10